MNDLKQPTDSRVMASKHRLAMEILRHKDREIAYLKRTLTQVALISRSQEIHRIVKYALANSLRETADETRAPDQWRIVPEDDAA
jgi:hypothetical protein